MHLLYRVIDAARGAHGKGMQSYLIMMAVRLLEMHRLLKPMGSIYLHCDPTASHYLKLLMDTVFGQGNYRNEISWNRANPKSLHTANFPNGRDTLLRYSKGDKATFHKVYVAHDPTYVAKAYKYTDDDGRKYRLLPLLNPNKDRPNLTYEFLGVTRVWRWTQERMQKAYEDGIVVQLKPGAVPQYKYYLDQSKGCVGCLVAFPFRNFTIDHIVSRNKGGTDHLDNLQLLCGACNSMKGTRTQEEFLAVLKREGIR